MESGKYEKLLRAFTTLLLTTLAFMLAGNKTQQTLESFETALLERTSLEATVYVDPSTTIAEVHQEFSLNVSISNVTDIYGWEFKLKWNSTLLEATNITESDFLKSQSDTLFVIGMNNTEGYIRAACTLIGSIPGVNGSGILATIEFYARTLGECVLDLCDTKLVSSTEQPILHTTADGTVQIGGALIGDLNGDSEVNILDAIILAAAFSSKSGDSNWNPAADINGDSEVDILDAIILAAHFGETI